MLTPEGYTEKEAVRIVVGDLVVTCLWHPELSQAHGETKEHYIKVYRVGDMIMAEVKHK